jgi:hypothetical protein
MADVGHDGWIQSAAWVGEQDCRCCGRGLPVTLGGACPSCDSVHCPFCGTAAHFWQDETFDLNEEPCPHLLGSFSDDLGDWEVWPFCEQPPPRLPAHLSLLLANASESAKQALLGPLRPILEAYERSSWHPRAALAGRPDEAILFDRLFDRLTTARRATSWSPRGLGLGASGGTDYFVTDADQAWAEILTTMDELKRRLQKLTVQDDASRLDWPRGQRSA